MSTYSRLLRPLLFRLPADRAHALAQAALGCAGPWQLLARRYPPDDPRLALELCSLPLRSPIGLAAGFDKDCTRIAALGSLGFGYLVLGSIMRESRRGHPYPRLVRRERERALVNALGLPSKGLAHAVQRLRGLRAWPVPLIPNVCGFSVVELVEAVTALQPHADALEIALICPNTGDRGGLGTLATFDALVSKLVAVRHVPLFLKLPTHTTAAERDLARQMVGLCRDAGLDGLTVFGGRQAVEPGLSVGSGALSGRPVFQDTLRVVTDVADWSGGRLPIKASGGVFRGRDVLTLLRAGATTVEIYTAFVYRGPGVVHALHRELLAAMDREGMPTLGALQPAAQVSTMKPREAAASAPGPPAAC